MMDMSLSKLLEIVKVRETWHAYFKLVPISPLISFATFSFTPRNDNSEVQSVLFTLDIYLVNKYRQGPPEIS